MKAQLHTTRSTMERCAAVQGEAPQRRALAAAALRAAVVADGGSGLPDAISSRCTAPPRRTMQRR